MNAPHVKLEKAHLLSLIERVAEREKTNESAALKTSPKSFEITP